METTSNLGSNTGGASGSQPQNVPQSEDIFMQNLGAFRDYAFGQGAYFDARGFLIYRGKVLTRSDTEYLDQSETTRQRLLDEEEIKAAWDNLVDYVFYQEGEDNE
jgi:hypothetical protein